MIAIKDVTYAHEKCGYMQGECVLYISFEEKEDDEKYNPYAAFKQMIADKNLTDAYLKAIDGSLKVSIMFVDDVVKNAEAANQVFDFMDAILTESVTMQTEDIKKNRTADNYMKWMPTRPMIGLKTLPYITYENYFNRYGAVVVDVDNSTDIIHYIAGIGVAARSNRCQVNYHVSGGIPDENKFNKLREFLPGNKVLLVCDSPDPATEEWALKNFVKIQNSF